MKLFRRRTQVHVVPVRTHDGVDWQIQVDGSDIPASRRSRKSDCMTVARIVAEAVQPSELYEHNADGQIADRSTYPRSSDPEKSKG